MRMGGNPDKTSPQWRQQRIVGVGAGYVGMHQFSHLVSGEVWFGIRSSLVRVARERQIGHRRQCSRSNKRGRSRRRCSGDARGQYQREIASSRVSCDRNPAYPVFIHPAVSRQHVVNSCRKGMFGRKPVVRHKRRGACPRGDVPNQVAIRLGAARVEPSAVQIQNRLVRST